jgi:hypothetical protein
LKQMYFQRKIRMIIFFINKKHWIIINKTNSELQSTD